MQRFCRSVLLLSALLGAAVAALQAQAQPYPNKRITLLIGVPPGGPLDLIPRLIVDRMKDSLGVPIIPENRPGAAAMLSFEAARVAPPDGYTLVVSNAGLIINKVMTKSFTADPLKDFTHIGQMTNSAKVFLAGPNAPYKTLNEFLAYARANPGRINFGTIYPLDTALLEWAASVKLNLVQYNASVQQMPALAGGVLDAALDVYQISKTFVDQGKARFLAVGTAKRFGLLPDVPAMAEQVPGYQAGSNFFGLSGPAGIPGDIVAKLNATMREAVNAPELKKKLLDQGFDPIGGSPEELRALIARELESGMRAAKLAGITPQ